VPFLRPNLRRRSLFLRTRLRARRCAAYAGLRLETLEDRWVPATFTVTNTNGARVGSLRQAIVDANANAAVADTIVFSSLFNSPQTVILSGVQLTLTYSATTTINGTGANLLSISGNNSSRVFVVDVGASAAVSGLKVTGGNTTGNGGGLNNDGTLTLINATACGNSTTGTGAGGAIRNYAAMTLTNATISGNSASGIGGGIWQAAGSATLTNVTISGNSAEASGGGGVWSQASTFGLTSTIIAGNTAASGSPDISANVTNDGNNLIGKTDGSSGWIGSDLTSTIASPIDPRLGTLAENADRVTRAGQVGTI
jgi:hypothetical protein